jgi:hypothetical protein
MAFGSKIGCSFNEEEGFLLMRKKMMPYRESTFGAKEMDVWICPSIIHMCMLP